MSDSREAFAFCFTDVNGKPSEFCDHPKHAAEGDTRIRTPLYTHPASAAPDEEYLRALQDAFDINQADANTEENYGSLCRIGSVLGKLKDPVARCHPCVTAYENLPESQRAKDYIFRAIIQTLS